MKFKVMFEKMTLVVLFSAALNLSFHATLPNDGQKLITTSDTFLNEQSFFLLPFREKEFNQSAQLISNSVSLSYSINPQWPATTQNQIIFGLIIKSASKVYKEFPILQFVKNLRI